MSFTALTKRLDELTKAATPPPWKVDPEDMMGPGSWGIHHPASMGQIFYVGDPYPRGDNSPVENCYLAAPAHEMAACVTALVELADAAEAHCALQDKATDKRVGLTQPITVAEGEALIEAQTKAIAALAALAAAHGVSDG